MNGPSRRQALLLVGGLGAGLLLGSRSPAAEQADRVIEIEAKRFEYTPNEIRVKRGEAVTLAIR